MYVVMVRVTIILANHTLYKSDFPVPPRLTVNTAPENSILWSIRPVIFQGERDTIEYYFVEVPC